MQKAKEILKLTREFLYTAIVLVVLVILVKGCHDQATLQEDNTALMNFVRAHNYITEQTSVIEQTEKNLVE